MIETEINIAIAEACGKEYHKPTEAEIRSGSYYQYEPDYCHDLNAMHEAESLLDGFKVDDRSMYYDYLLLIAADTDRWRTVTVDKFEREWVMLRTTARQRAEAFVRAIGKWKE